jgi:hypothetical protein
LTEWSWKTTTDRRDNNRIFALKVKSSATLDNRRDFDEIANSCV